MAERSGSERPRPYVEKEPGDIIYSGDWNELQIQAKEEISENRQELEERIESLVQSHRHTGGDEGKPVPREGIERHAVDGSRIDPATKATVQNLTVSGKLKVDGSAILGDIPDLGASLLGLENGKVNRAGDTISGNLTLSGNLSIGGGLRLQSGASVTSFSSDATLKTNSDESVPTAKAVKAYVDERLPRGMVVMWSGSERDIPAGWALCDGSVPGRPDLRGRFVLGYGSAGAKVGDRGGEAQHILTVDEMPPHGHPARIGGMDRNASHRHGIKTRQDDWNGRGGKRGEPSWSPDAGRWAVYAHTEQTDINHTHGVTVSAVGGGKAHNNMPPFYVLAFIIKL